MTERNVVDDTLYQSQPSVDVSAEIEAAISGAKQEYEDALAVLTSIMNDSSAPPETRVHAASLILGHKMQVHHLEQFRRQQERVGDYGPSES